MDLLLYLPGCGTDRFRPYPEQRQLARKGASLRPGNHCACKHSRRCDSADPPLPAPTQRARALSMRSRSDLAVRPLAGRGVASRVASRTSPRASRSEPASIGGVRVRISSRIVMIVLPRWAVVPLFFSLLASAQTVFAARGADRRIPSTPARRTDRSSHHRGGQDDAHQLRLFSASGTAWWSKAALRMRQTSPLSTA